MDVLYRISGIEFRWEVRKAASNIEKHGIRFEEACEVFFDPLAVAVDAATEEESRAALIGETEQRDVLFVVHAENEDDAIRIISSREATAAERRDDEDPA